MPELLSITNPVPGHDSAVNPRGTSITPNDPRIQNVTDPSRVGRPDARTDRQDTGAQEDARQLRFDSNFSAFLERLREMPSLTATLSRLLSQGTVVSSGVGEGTAAELARLLEALQMDAARFPEFLQGQLAAGTRFGGPLFAFLLDAYRGSGSEGMQSDILQFLRRYGDYSSTAHIEGNLQRILAQMSRSVPARWAGPLTEFAARFQNGAEAEDRAGNLKLLQGEVIPHISEYVNRTHDMGRARGLLTQLTLNLSRYENGSREGLLQSFHQLLTHPHIRDRLGSLSDDALLNILKNTDFFKAAQADSFADHLASAAEQALRGKSGSEAQSAFRELVSAFLVNESVYMPLNHFILPLEWNEKMVFSEFWVDPDADRESSGRQDKQSLRFLFKLDIQSLGFFDLILTCRNEAVDLQVQCPQRAAPFSAAMEQALSRILTEHGLQAASVRVKPMERPVTISEVFPEIFEGKDSINVKV